MTCNQFCIWLKGYLEAMSDVGLELNDKQLKIVKAKLDSVFKHEIDPSFGDEAHQSELNTIHHYSTKDDIYRC